MRFERTDREDIEYAVSSSRGMTPEDHDRILTSLCALAAEQVAQHRDPARTLAWQDPLSQESRALLQRLRRNG